MKRIEDLESKFRFVHAAARRTRQLQGGSQPHIQYHVAESHADRH